MQLQAQISLKRESAEIREFHIQLKDHDKYCDRCNNDKRCDRRPRLGENKKSHSTKFKKVDSSDN